MATLRFLVQLVLLFLSPVGASKKNHDHQGATKIDTAINGPLLLNELLLDYDSFARPSSHNGGPCQVQVNLSPSYVAWKEDQLKATVTLEQTWMDERLKFAGDKELKLDDVNTRLWLPDTIFHTALESRPTIHGFITIQPSGQVRWLQQLLLIAPCPLEPNEVWSSDGVVNCTVAFSSRSCSGSELEYAWSPSSVVTASAASSQLRKLHFMTGNAEKTPALSNATANETLIAAPVVNRHSELKAVFTVQTDFTRSVLRYLTKKAMKDL